MENKIPAVSYSEAPPVAAGKGSPAWRAGPLEPPCNQDSEPPYTLRIALERPSHGQ